jgi:hypothetical protein
MIKLQLILLALVFPSVVNANDKFIGISAGYLLYSEKLQSMEVCLDGRNGKLTEVDLSVKSEEPETYSQRVRQFKISQAKRSNSFLYELINSTLHEHGDILVGHLGVCKDHVVKYEIPKNYGLYKQALNITSKFKEESLLKFSAIKNPVSSVPIGTKPELSSALNMWGSFASICHEIKSSNKLLAYRAIKLSISGDNITIISDSGINPNPGGCVDCDAAWHSECNTPSKVTDYDQDNNIEYSYIFNGPDVSVIALHEIVDGKSIIKATASESY